MLKGYRTALTAAVAIIGAMPGMVQQASAQELMNVSAQVGNGCTLTVPDLSFGIVDPLASQNDASANLVIDCNPNTFVSISLTGDGGLAGGTSGNTRTMALDGAAANVSDDGKNLEYLLSYDPEGAQGSTSWINQSEVAFTLDANGDHTAEVIGTMLSQAAPEEGVYSDVISFTVGFNEPT